MNYAEYYMLCREQFEATGDPRSSTKDFYKNPVIRIPTDTFGLCWRDAVNRLSSGVKSDLDSMPQDPVMTKHADIWKYRKELEKISNFLVPFLEKNHYGCHLYVDKIYIYRTAKVTKPESSYVWHYDNNPAEVVKTIVYLNDVTLKNSPFEFLADEKQRGIIVEPTRRGPDHWLPAPNAGRVENKVAKLMKKGYSGFKVIGKKGTAYAFCNDAIHRVNPIIEGYRDVVNIRVRPTLTPAPSYVDPRWTTSYEVKGSVVRDPEIAWKK